MTLPYQTFTKVRCPSCDRRIAGVPEDDGLRLVIHASRERIDRGGRRKGCDARGCMVVKDTDGTWRRT